jgi:hypothetical protein
MPYSPSLEVTPEAVKPGQVVTLNGSGFGAKERIYAYFDQSKIDNWGWYVDGAGNFSTEYTIPATTVGEHRFIFRGVSSGAEGTAIFTVRYNPILTLSPSATEPSKSIDLSVTGLAGQEYVVVYFDQQEMLSGEIRSLQADDSGNWQGSLTLPENAEGDHIIRVVGQTSGAQAIKGYNLDEFSATLGEWWLWQDPDDDCQKELADGSLRITVPTTGNDLSTETNFGAPRLLMLVNGDFVALTKVTVNPTADYQGAGILIWQDNPHYLTFERAQTSTGQAITCPAGEAEYDGATVYLRLSRQGDDFSY